MNVRQTLILVVVFLLGGADRRRPRGPAGRGRGRG